MPRLSKIGAAALAAFGWTGLNTVSASYLVVAGGGGGGGQGNASGAGGAGGLLTGTSSLNPTLSYTVTVGAGGVGSISSSARGSNGSNSVFNSLTSIGGGGGGSQGTGVATGASGGSGGGGAGGNPGEAGGAGTSGQGNAGGAGLTDGTTYVAGGGGGGASAVGANAAFRVGGNGGAGSASSISGSSVTYAGGGGGGCNNSYTAGTGGAGGGGNGTNNATTGGNGTTSLGGGGGGSGNGNGGSGGSGVVIISYVGVQQFGGGVVTVSGSNTIHTFTTSGTLSPLSSLTASALVVAGGGAGGGDRGGGGGAGGFRTGSGITIDTNSIYTVTVGAGGAGVVTSTGNSGSDSTFFSITSAGGGGGGAGGNGVAGGSGGGGWGSSGSGPFTGGAGNTPSTSPSQGNNGGTGEVLGDRVGGGGGGASAVGTDGTSNGAGGAGTASSISGTSVTYAGGGGGGGLNAPVGTGGAGGGGAGVTSGSGNPGTANTGGGGGGAGDSGAGRAGGAGGSGIVIISYPGSTQQMAGGTVTVAGGNVIHTFTSSGYLAPIYSANNSLRFRASNNNYLARTYGTPTNNKVWTWSAWVKRGSLSLADANHLFMASPQDVTANPTTYSRLIFETDNTLRLQSNNSAGELFTSSAVYRDPAAWYHIVLSMNASSTVVNCFVNGTEITYASRTNPTNTNTAINGAGNFHRMGFFRNAEPRPFDGYMAEINFIDGQALTPNSFGTSNGLGVWQPIRYGGSYGTNGFYLPFTNTTSTTTLGYDFSPNGNNWTTNNISLTAGSTYDSMTDVPTLTSTTAANYATLNPLVPPTGAVGLTWSNGNLNLATINSGAPASESSSFSTAYFPSTGKFYVEMTVGTTLGTGSNSWPRFGVAGLGMGIGGFVNFSGSSYGTFITGDVMMVAWDASAGYIWWGKNGTWLNSGVPASGTGYISTFTYDFNSAYVQLTLFYSTTGSTASVNFGQQPFAHTPPTGFVRLNTFNLTTPTIGATAATTANKYFNAVTYTGAGAGTVITSGFYPDFAWMKNRTAAFSNFVQDSVRGGSLYLLTDTTDADATISPSSTFSSTGITINGLSSYASNSSYNYVLWAWNANSGSTSNITVGQYSTSPNVPSIASTVSANTTAGFSIVTYTGTGANATVGHGLGVAPSWVIVKNRTTAGTSWNVYHISTGNTGAMFLESTAAFSADSTRWNNTTPTSTVFSIGSGAGVNQNTNNLVAYCWAPIAGYSAFGSYTGNGSSDGVFVYLGFRARFIMIKSTSTGGWVMLDTARDTYNDVDNYLYAQSSAAEAGSSNVLDINSNGFKIRNSWTDINGSSTTYIYMAFAENPFKYANAR